MHDRPSPFRRLSVLLPLALLAAMLGLPLHAQGPDEPRALGLRPPTVEEEDRLRLLAPKAARVLPNARALARANDERLARGLAPLSIPVVPDGSELVLSSDVAVSAALALDPAFPAAAAADAIPSAADNSMLAAFPPIRNQGEIGSCACFSSVYYMSTFMISQARGLNVRNAGDADKLSPKFIYPFVNRGADVGSWFTDIFEMLLKHGAPTWSNYPYSGVDTPSSYLEWPTNASVWRSALGNRMASSYTLTDIDTDAGLTRLKTALANGSIMVFATNVNGWEYGTAGDDPATASDNALVGRPVVKAMRIHSSGHAMTIVGYNDNLWIDLNKNGRVDAGEKGALRIANSWGATWQDGGFVWVSYDALRPTSAVVDVGTDISSNRAGSTGGNKAIWYATAYGLTARASYTPQLLGEFTIKGVTGRNQLRMTLGRGASDAAAPDATFIPGAVVAQGGYFSFNGTRAAVDATFVFDFTDLRQNGTYRYFLNARDSASGDAATIDSFRLLDSQGNAVATSAVGVPLTVDNSSGTAYHVFTVATAPPSITSPLAASAAVGAPFTYVIVATGNPTGFSATALPSGLTLNATTGTISGTPVAAGSVGIAISATNANGTDNRTLVLAIAAAIAPPSITSAPTAAGTSGSPFSYQITASNSPTSFGINGSLPNGLSVNLATGLITGTPAQTGTFNVQMSATNAGGTALRALPLTIAAPTSDVPAINSAPTAAIDAGNLFNYRIQATNSPTTFGALNLPAGLVLDAATGAITGRVSLARTYPITLSATNATGTGVATLSLEVRGNSSFAPANDNFANRILLNGATVATTGSNTNATAEAGEPAHAGTPAATSVWWSWTAPSSGSVTVSTTGSVPAMSLAVYTGSSVSALASFAPSAGIGTFNVVAGTVYHIAVDSIVNNTGSITLALTLTAPPPSRPTNDNFATATALTGTAATANAITEAATAESGEPAHGSTAAAKSVWYKWTAPSAGRCVVSTKSSDFDTFLSIYTGTALEALTLVVRDDDGGGNLTSEAAFNATAGTTYQIAADGFRGAKGNLALSLAFTAGASGPVNDNFASATIMTGAVAILGGSTVNASREASEPAHAGNTAARSVWFRWVATGSGLVTLSTNGTAFDTVLAVYTGSSVASLTSIASNDDSGTGSTSLVAFNAVAGTTYSFAVDGYEGAVGTYTLTLALASGPAPNNAFASPTALTTGVRVVALTTAASAEAGEPAHFTGNAAAKSVWWSWVAPASGFVSISTAGSSFDTVLAVYTGTALASLTRIAENDDASAEDVTSTVFFRAVAGRTYLIAVDGYSGEAGTVLLVLTQSANASSVYATDFERFTAGAGQLVNQDQWNEIGAPSSGNAQGILPQGFPGQGQAGYLGYGAPDFSNTTSSNTVFVYRPLNFDPVADGVPVVQIRTDINIIASTNGRNDVFRVSLYSRNGTLLGGFVFDTATLRVSTSDGATLTPAAFTFTANTRYTLLGTFNFATRRWTARINSTELVADVPFAVGVTAADVGDFDFVWRIADAQRNAGNNFMIFDNLAITADPVATSVPVVVLPTAPPTGSVFTALSYVVSAINGPINSFSATGLPAGLTINSVTGLVTGTPTQTGTFQASFNATNSRGQSATSSATFTILAGPPVISSSAATTARLGQAFTFQVTATNSPRAFEVRGTTALPSGLSLNTTTGLISGTPRTAGLHRLTVAADNAAGSGSAQLDLMVENPDISRIINLAIRSQAGTGAQTLIIGVTTGGAGTGGAKALLFRATGPALVAFGVPGTIADPKLDLFSGTTIVATNDNWEGNAQVTTIGTQVGAFALTSPTSKDAALYNPALAAGGYSVQITGIGGGTGVALAEIYDATPVASFTANTPRLINVSARTQVGTGGDILIAGFTIGGSARKTVLIRAAGPTLANFGVAGVMADPQLELYSGPDRIDRNDNWLISTASTAASVGAFAFNAGSKDAALLVTLAPGGYTVQVSGVGGTTGVALVEIYEVP